MVDVRKSLEQAGLFGLSMVEKNKTTLRKV